MMRITKLAAALGLVVAVATSCGRTPEGEISPLRPAQGSGAAAISATIHRVPIDDAPVRGDSKALVTLVAFSDYECPFCAKGHTTLDQLQKAYGDKLRIVARQHPLPFHTHAEPAALAAIAAL